MPSACSGRNAEAPRHHHRTGRLARERAPRQREPLEEVSGCHLSRRCEALAERSRRRAPVGSRDREDVGLRSPIAVIRFTAESRLMSASERTARGAVARSVDPAGGVRAWGAWTWVSETSRPFPAGISGGSRPLRSSIFKGSSNVGNREFCQGRSETLARSFSLSEVSDGEGSIARAPSLGARFQVLLSPAGGFERATVSERMSTTRSLRENDVATRRDALSVARARSSMRRASTIASNPATTASGTPRVRRLVTPRASESAPFPLGFRGVFVRFGSAIVARTISPVPKSVKQTSRTTRPPKISVSISFT